MVPRRLRVYSTSFRLIQDVDSNQPVGLTYDDRGGK